MCDIGIIDTGVLIGFVIKQDQHHETTKQYIIDEELDTIYIPPRANEEFKKANSYIREKLKKETRTHRRNVIDEINQSKLKSDTIQYLRDNVLDRDEQSRAYAFLYRYYTQKYKQSGILMKSNLLQDLSNIEYEIQEDRSNKYGGWQSHVDIWNKDTGSYTDLKDNLLIPQSTDLDILIESHHISINEPENLCEFGTTNPKDFIKKYPKEHCSREEDICNKTDLENVRNLIKKLDRHYPS